jgi:phospholipid/cholesterol/gamma-HCH transport system substrate-binding protein
METRANYVIVGIFTLAAILAAFGFVYWTAAIGERGETATLRIRIPGSASGLGRGSAVLFNGVRVGDVQRVYIDFQNPNVAIADTQVDRFTPITRSTRADIGIAGLTGQANIELRGADPQEPNLLDEAEQGGTVAEITANPSAVTNLLETAQDIFERTNNVLTQLEGFVGENRAPLSQTVRNIERFSNALAQNADGVEKFLSSVSALSEELSGVSGRIESTFSAAEELLRSVDRQKIGTIVANVETFTNSLRESSDDLERVVARVETTVTSVNEFSQKASDTLDKVDGVVEAVDPSTVRNALANIGRASETADRAAADIAKVTDTFARRANDIDLFIANARELSNRLNHASLRVDGVLAKVDSLLGSGQAEGLMSNAGETLRSFRRVADTLNARLGTITEGLARFSNQGLREVEALATDTRRSINRIEQAVSDFERNPQRILSGGEGAVRQYDGRARR